MPEGNLGGSIRQVRGSNPRQGAPTEARRKAGLSYLRRDPLTPLPSIELTFGSMQKCAECGALVRTSVVVAGQRLDLRGRRRCLDCLPHRPLRSPRKGVRRPGADEVMRRLRRGVRDQGRDRRQASHALPAHVLPSLLAVRGAQHVEAPTGRPHPRRACGVPAATAQCDPLSEPEEAPEDAEASCRRARRSLPGLRLLRLRRRARVPSPRCIDEGFAIGSASVSRARLWAEAEKCDLVCANCHRARHAANRKPDGAPVVQFRRRTKVRAVEVLGGRCRGCDRALPVAAFEFHHLAAGEKEFAISSDGIPRPWPAIAAELAKCVLLCANCHREVHAGVRELFDDGLTGLAEPAAAYAA